MSNNARRLILSAALLYATLLLTAVALALASPFSFDKSGVLPSGKKFSVTISESPYKRHPDDLPDDGSRWGIDGGFPTPYCTTFAVKIDGKPVNLLRKSFQDLSHLNSVEISEENRNLVVSVQGGDAAGSFDARFIFREFEVERIVRSGEFPNSIWERTVYHNSLAVDVD